MKFAIRLGAALAAMLTLLAPALWNGFPFLQYDTGGYLARWFEGYLVPSRSVVYGLFVAAGWPLDFWPVVVLQAAATVWVLALVLRTHGLGGRPKALLAVVFLLSVSTTATSSVRSAGSSSSARRPSAAVRIAVSDEWSELL